MRKKRPISINHIYLTYPHLRLPLLTFSLFHYSLSTFYCVQLIVFSATHCWSSWASSSSVCQTLSMMSQGLPRLAKREDGTWRKTGNIIFPSGLEIFSAKNGNAWEKTENIVFHLTWKYFQRKKAIWRSFDKKIKYMRIKEGIYFFPRLVKAGKNPWGPATASWSCNNFCHIFKD